MLKASLRKKRSKDTLKKWKEPFDGCAMFSAKSKLMDSNTHSVTISAIPWRGQHPGMLCLTLTRTSHLKFLITSTFSASRIWCNKCAYRCTLHWWLEVFPLQKSTLRTCQSHVLAKYLTHQQAALQCSEHVLRTTAHRNDRLAKTLFISGFVPLMGFYVKWNTCMKYMAAKLSVVNISAKRDTFPQEAEATLKSHIGL